MPTRITSQEGVVTTIERNPKDPLQRETKRVQGHGTKEAKTSTTSYHPQFNLPTRTTVRDATGNSVTIDLTYNDKGNPTKIRSSSTTHSLAGNKASLVREASIRYTHHKNGQVATMTVDGPRTDVNDTVVFGYHPNGILAYQKDPLGTTRYENLDALGRPQRIVHPNGTTTIRSYDWAGRVLSENRAGLVTKYSYYKNGLLRAVTTPNVNQVTFTYDAVNRLQTMTDSLGNHHEYTYDALGRPVLAREGNEKEAIVSKSQSVRYNTAGRTIQTFPTDFGGEQFAVTYNKDFQSVHYKDALAKTITLSLDALGRQVAAKNHASGLVHTALFDVFNNLRRSGYTGPEGAARSQQFSIHSGRNGWIVGVEGQ